MPQKYVPIVKHQTDILLKNVQETFAVVTGRQMNAVVVKWPLWKHFYHLLHSLDQWFVNPLRYTHPAFHREGLNYFDAPDDVSLSKEQLLEYFRTIRDKIDTYVSALTDDALCECPENCTFSRLDLIVGQSRHLMYNLGMIHIMLQMESGTLPRYIGLSQPV